MQVSKRAKRKSERHTWQAPEGSPDKRRATDKRQREMGDAASISGGDLFFLTRKTQGYNASNDFFLLDPLSTDAYALLMRPREARARAERA